MKQFLHEWVLYCFNLILQFTILYTPIYLFHQIIHTLLCSSIHYYNRLKVFKHLTLYRSLICYILLCITKIKYNTTCLLRNSLSAFQSFTLLWNFQFKTSNFEWWKNAITHLILFISIIKIEKKLYRNSIFVYKHTNTFYNKQWLNVKWILCKNSIPVHI